ncbi:ferrous iron transporter B [Arthrospira platensis]|uniref:ferrous iron transporter B n=1 Tax=Limnospira TaxID=2596745 RepID=UPI0001C3891B|nr:ferrous iron transporter B [Arthrospira platensis]AMW29782.1 ferrous iron transporter B [Arthrospira platensis YZ]KDR54142.1 ferrous iron transporter B [Arthrospira platensis str. Paraca]MBD2669514.1 ferrous iron transporter B [Arthrospira platensis FACHB-439]MBD2710087.1 ferrous iron transporter B [Arthrospira platensis FACHB-835]MDF2212223.1 ferrous iron transporter B [Arthrospira platensis NCB002]MDT9182706.1 ferrous iron transporter B [Limnospira sp. PMC 289.06]MDT9294822.1 ferrous ir
MLSPVVYYQPIEIAIAQIQSLLLKDNSFPSYTLSHRSLALLILQRDPQVWETIKTSPYREEYDLAIRSAQVSLDVPISRAIAITRQEKAGNIEKEVLTESASETSDLAEKLHQITVNPITGFPLLLIILYFGVYKFVGEFGAGILVDLIEGGFETYINPKVDAFVAAVIPLEIFQDLLANDYGIITLGVRYAIAIVLPVVGTYFLMFSLLEDSGYLPRLSLMLDQLFKIIGLSGRAVIPMVLGLGCDTMATVVTRTLETRRERMITIFLLALAVPCAAQWGVILGLLSMKPTALLIWGGFILSVFLIVGAFTSRIIPGNRSEFYMEVPPLRIPKLQNILLKTYLRMKGYFWEIVPLFIWVSVFIWIGHLTGVFSWLVGLLEPITLALGLPREVAPIFLYGFFRRDYGAAGLFDLTQTGILTGNQLVVTAIVLTLFLPCVAQFQVMVKEQGLKITLIMVALIIPFAFTMGYGANFLLDLVGVNF